MAEPSRNPDGKAKGFILVGTARFELTTSCCGGSHLKYKFVESGSFIFTGHNTKRSITLGLLAEDGGGIVPAGKLTIPPNHRIPAIGQVCETRFLYAFKESGSIYQPVYLGERDDIPTEDCTTAQLKYKTESVPVAA